MMMKRVASTLAICAALPAAAQELSLSAPGADDDLTDLLENTSLVLSLTDDEEVQPTAQDYVAAARADYRALLTALYSEGYYNGTISILVNGQEASTIAPLEAPASVGSVAIRIDPGQPFTFARTQVAPVTPDTELPEEFAPGETARLEPIRQAARAGVEGWREAGHAKADIADQQITARHPARELDVAIAIAPGPRLTFGPLLVEGNEAVRTSAILRIAGLPVGEVYSPSEVDAAARRLRETGAFDSIALREAEAIGPGNTLPITAIVAESLPRRFGFGLELASIDGLTVSAFWLHRNLFGGAERFRVEGEVSGLGGNTGGIDYRIATSLNIPAIYGPKTDLIATAEISREDEPDYLLDSISAEVIASRYISDALEVSGGVGILVAREETPINSRDYALLTLPLSAEYDMRDDPTDAKNGYYLEAEATPFIAVDGSQSGARLYGDARIYRSFGEDDRFTLAARAQVGSVVGPDARDAPVDYLFFSGGSGTVRGQAYKSLGIEVLDGTDPVQVGGASFAGAQIEGRVNVTDSIGVVGFYDYGYVGRTETPLTDGRDHSGVGIGVRYNTGIGPIRLDVGTPVTGDDAFSRVELYIGIGQAF